ncbi:uncharacterized protein PHALS_01532 [Plasmopara halstedii]|uniref:Uncharacterized protein n=1 Tax=Plasmopara halstedii TaxID=4781 RepID=A0A0P1AVQ3_PLAHL|nr:uncharacterized protein PHALS_01532 [Plasmopara halstedii]CEG45220.1 hypothetical protein PHALS_01532 [Plasmopara halstedii]|eukprot:XP_024581589.1 hypothetical protein PHALS_01532 [Plasmopara halstedii]
MTSWKYAWNAIKNWIHRLEQALTALPSIAAVFADNAEPPTKRYRSVSDDTDYSRDFEDDAEAMTQRSLTFDPCAEAVAQKPPSYVLVLHSGWRSRRRDDMA